MNSQNIIESAIKNQSLEEWNKGSKLSETPLLLYHGTYSNPVFDEIILEVGSGENHFANGLHLTNNTDEASGHYAADLNQPISEINHIDIAAKINLFIDDIEANNNYAVYEKLKKQFFLTNDAKEILDRIYDEDEYFKENTSIFFDFINKCKKTLTSHDFLTNFKISPDKFNDEFIKSISDDPDLFFQFIKNIYCQNEGLIIPFYLRSENPLFCIDPKIAEDYGFESTHFFNFDYYQNFKEIQERTQNTIEDFKNELLAKGFDEIKVNILIDYFIVSIDEAIEYCNEYYYNIVDGIADDLFSEDEISDILYVFNNHFIEDDTYALFLDNDEYEKIVKEHNLFCSFFEKIRDHLLDQEYNSIINILDELHGERVSFRDFIYKIQEYDPDLKYKITNKIIPMMFDVAVFYANHEFDYIDKYYGDETFHYLVFDSKCVKYAYNESFSKKTTNMAARKVEENTDFCLDKEEISLSIRKIREIYPYFPKTIIHKHKHGVAAEFDRDNEVIHIYQKNIKSEAELLKTLLHEYIIHYGLHKTLGSDGEKLLLETYNYFNKNNQLEDIKEAYPEFDEKTTEGKCRLAEEKLAFMCENQLFKKNDFLDKVSYKIKTLFLRVKNKLGLSHMNDKIFLTIDTIDKSLKIQNDFNAKHSKQKPKNSVLTIRRKGLGF